MDRRRQPQRHQQPSGQQRAHAYGIFQRLRCRRPQQVVGQRNHIDYIWLLFGRRMLRPHSNQGGPGTPQTLQGWFILD